MGPYTRAARPLFATGDDGLRAPGGADTWNDAHSLAFHTGPTDNRQLYTALYAVSGSAMSV